MALTKETTSATIKKYGAKDTDTGNVKVQIALMTQRIQQLTPTKPYEFSSSESSSFIAHLATSSES